MSTVMRCSAGLACAVILQFGCAGRLAKPAVARGDFPYRANAQRTGAYDSEGPRKATDTVVFFTKPGKLGFGLGFAGPAVAGEVAYFAAADSYLYAYDVKHQRELWRYKTGTLGSGCTPAVFDGVVYFGSEDSVLRALDAMTGTERWRFRTGGGVTSSPIVGSDLVLFGSDDGNL